MKISIRDMTKIAICTALLCVSAYIAVPIPFTPIVLTMQTLIVNMIALILKPKNAFLTILLYIIVGAFGLPVFSGGTGGFGRLFTAAGGYLLGFLIAAPLISRLKGKRIISHIFAAVFIGMTIIYATVTIHMCLVVKSGLEAAVMSTVVPFIIGDLIKCILAAVLAFYVNKALVKAHLSDE